MVDKPVLDLAVEGHEDRTVFDNILGTTTALRIVITIGVGSTIGIGIGISRDVITWGRLGRPV